MIFSQEVCTIFNGFMAGRKVGVGFNLRIILMSRSSSGSGNNTHTEYLGKYNFILTDTCFIFGFVENSNTIQNPQNLMRLIQPAAAIKLFEYHLYSYNETSLNCRHHQMIVYMFFLDWIELNWYPTANWSICILWNFVPFSGESLSLSISLSIDCSLKNEHTLRAHTKAH